MAASTSYRLPVDLKRRLAEQAAIEGTTETALVTRLLEEGMQAIRHPGIVCRGGPAGRRAAIAGGPDVWEVVVAVRHARGLGDAKVRAAAREMELPERLVRLAVNFAAEHEAEIEERIALNEAAAERARELTKQRERLIAS